MTGTWRLAPDGDLTGKRQLTATPTVLLQAMKQEPPLDQKCRDKFLVQSVAMTGDREFQSVSTIVGLRTAGHPGDDITC